MGLARYGEEKEGGGLFQDMLWVVIMGVREREYSLVSLGGRRKGGMEIWEGTIGEGCLTRERGCGEQIAIIAQRVFDPLSTLLTDGMSAGVYGYLCIGAG